VGRNIRVLGTIAALSVLLWAGPRAAQPARLAHLGGIEDLRAWFNAGQGHPRVIVLLSPT
jgi:hypothetical protein